MIRKILSYTFLLQGCFLFFFSSIFKETFAQTYESGQSYSGANDYVTYHAGNLPLIISIPHGGLLKPETISDRSCTGCVIINDSNTRDLGLTIKEVIKEITGCSVHLIVNELHRSKLDANREIGEAALSEPEAEVAWTEYHAFVDSAKQQILMEWGKGLLIDLHGHGHDIQRLEIGYRISGSELRMTDNELNNSTIIDETSIKNLVEFLDLSLSEVIRGEDSLGDFFDLQGYDAVPSSNIPSPNSNEPYFQGGYITDRYGSKDGSSIDAIQIECHQEVRLNDLERARFADSVSVTLLSFLKQHYFSDLEMNYCLSTSNNQFNSQYFSKIFPNPTCRTIIVSDRLLNNNLQIFDVLGKQVQSLFVNHINLTFPHLEEGIYFFQFINNKGSRLIQKIIIRCE